MSTLNRPISPPPLKRPRGESLEHSVPAKKKPSVPGVPENEETEGIEAGGNGIRVVRSPIRLYSIQDLPPSENIETTTLREVFSPTSTLDELWSFNFMTNMPWLQAHIGSQDEKRIKIRIVHGYWRQEDESRKIMEQGVWGDNVKLISAYLPDPYGTHHSKVIVLFRTNNTAQIVVQTGMSCEDFTNPSEHDTIRP
jgi:tyrosyl-DNA phosphodiesterase 1